MLGDKFFVLLTVYEVRIVRVVAKLVVVKVRRANSDAKTRKDEKSHIIAAENDCNDNDDEEDDK